jgi:hypothetical protein
MLLLAAVAMVAFRFAVKNSYHLVDQMVAMVVAVAT